VQRTEFLCVDQFPCKALPFGFAREPLLVQAFLCEPGGFCVGPPGAEGLTGGNAHEWRRSWRAGRTQGASRS
jgi:hypothetical protein